MNLQGVWQENVKLGRGDWVRTNVVQQQFLGEEGRAPGRFRGIGLDRVRNPLRLYLCFCLWVRETRVVMEMGGCLEKRDAVEVDFKLGSRAFVSLGRQGWAVAKNTNTRKKLWFSAWLLRRWDGYVHASNHLYNYSSASGSKEARNYI